MKRYIAVILTAVLCLSLCACAGGNTSSEAEGESTVSAENTSAQEVSVKESSKPESSKPESSKPESSKPESSAPESSTPESSTPESSTPESSTPESSEPESSEPESSEPESSAPESSEPESSEPESSEPESSEPESSEPESSAQSRPQPQPAGEPVDSGWFDDALFIGDSVTLKLSYYSDYGSLGNAEFLCAGSLGYNNAQMGLYEYGNVHPEYRGQKVLVDEGAAMIAPAKIFIMLGMNDIGMYGVDGAVEAMKVVTARIASKCPDAVIYVQSVTPMLENMQLRDLNNRTIAEFNSKLQPVCNERGYIYLDVASAMDDGRGNLVYEYCGDPTAMGLHFSDKGCEVWVDYLKTHVAR